MKSFLSLILLTLIFFTSCISISKTEIISRKDFIDASKITKKPFKKILVQWKNYPYSDYHKVSMLEKESQQLKPVEINQKDYIKFKKMVIESATQIGLYDEFNGSGTLKVLLISYGRWSYEELLSTYLTDTAYIFILPSSLSVNYKITAFFEKEQKEERVENEGYVKTTFFLPLFPLYPLFRFSGAEKTTLSYLIDKTLIEIVQRLNENN